MPGGRHAAIATEVLDPAVRARILPASCRPTGRPRSSVGLNPWTAPDEAIIAALACVPLIRITPDDGPLEAGARRPGRRAWIWRQAVALGDRSRLTWSAGAGPLFRLTARRAARLAAPAEHQLRRPDSPGSPRRARPAPRSAPPARRGTTAGGGTPPGPRRPCAARCRSARSRRARGGCSVSAMLATSKQTWWNPSPLLARKRATPVVSSVGWTSSTLDSPTGRNAIVTPVGLDVAATRSTGRPRMSRQNPSDCVDVGDDRARRGGPGRAAGCAPGTRDATGRVWHVASSSDRDQLAVDAQRRPEPVGDLAHGGVGRHGLDDRRAAGCRCRAPRPRGAAWPPPRPRGRARPGPAAGPRPGGAPPPGRSAGSPAACPDPRPGTC